MRRQNPTFEEKVTAIAGDISLPDVGLKGDDKKILMEEVDVIFHCAATVRFDDSLKVSTELNVRAIRDLLVMAKQMKQLRVGCMKNLQYKIFHHFNLLVAKINYVFLCQLERLL